VSAAFENPFLGNDTEAYVKRFSMLSSPQPRWKRIFLMDEMCLAREAKGNQPLSMIRGGSIFFTSFTRHYLRSCPKMTYFGDEMVSLALRVDGSKKRNTGVSFLMVAKNKTGYKREVRSSSSR
jgi:hypothetical protein